MPKIIPKPLKKKQDIEVATNVLETAIKGIKALEEALDDSFSQAVDLIYGTKGRVIISGMGKSGHVARKIAATMSSTGTPTHFLHPGEASHGDMGVVGKDDVVILLSNSGETAELKDIIYYTKRFDIPLIGVVRRDSSTLVEAADISFVLPEIEESSPTGAPTTSTTMMIVWGDALAMALLERRGFSKEDFHVYHPGGKLGSRFLKVGEVMRKGKDLPVVTDDTPMTEALIAMTQKSLGCTAVLAQDGKVCGIITDGDLRRHVKGDFMKKDAGNVMTPNPICISPNMLAIEALGIMNSKGVTTLVVADNDRELRGILHIHDLLREGVA
jgi:arabinose-5-phosphate isomerase